MTDEMGDNNTSSNSSSSSSGLNRTLTNPQFFENAWIVAEVVTVILTITVTWMLVSFFTYWKRHRKLQHVNTQNKATARLLLFATIPCFSTLARFISTEVAMIIERVAPMSAQGDALCEISLDITTVTYFLSTSTTYMFFYYRQRVLYKQPTIKHLDTCVVTFLRYFFVVAIVAASLAATFIFIHPLRFHISNFGCILRPATDANALLPNLMGMTVLNVSHLLLFALFIHPLVRHCSAIEDDTQSESVRKRNYKTIRAATLSLLCCIISDMVSATVVVFLVPSFMPAPLVNAILDGSLMINIVAIVFCFDNYQKILLGSYKRVKTSKVRPSTRLNNTDSGAVQTETTVLTNKL